MSITLGDRVRVPERVTFRRVREEMALLDVETGVYFGLDEVGARMWELLAEHAEHGNLETVARHIEREFDVAPDDVRRDLLRLAEELKAKGLIEVS
jgi:hypothetical protein